MSDDLPTLPRFRDVYVRGGADRYDEVTKALTALVAEPWKRDTEIEEQRALRETANFRVFWRAGTDRGPEVRLYIVEMKHTRDLGVSNIVPATGQLSYDEYNGALDDFVDRFLHQACSDLGLDIDLTSPVYDVSAEMGDEVARALAAVSRGPAKGTVPSHPSDIERWNRFVLLAYRSTGELSATDLGRLLEADGWPDEAAAEMAITYESNLQLLAYATTH